MLYRDAFKRLKRDPLVVVCLGIIVLTIILAVLTFFSGIVDPASEVFESKDEVTQLDRSYHPPTLVMAFGDYSGLQSKLQTQETHDRLDKVFEGGLFSKAAWHLPFGADKSGRNVLAMVLHGLRWAFIIGLVTTVISIALAVPIGAVAGFFGGRVDDVIVWFYTTLASVPFLLLLIAILSAIPVESRAEFGMWAVLVVIGLVTWIGLARLVRAEFMKHKQREYVQACRALGYGNGRIIFGHILPNVSHIVIISFTIGFISSVTIEVFLTFVGVGASTEDMTWGRIITNAKTELSRDPSVWWPLAAATVMLFVLSLAFSIFGDALRDALDPKLKT
jgi:ABC-type dipeptide/oligopeptide/nickel transport system permease subunit